MFGQLEQAGVDVTRVGPALNKFFRDTAAAGEDPRDALEGVTQAIAGAETSADALNIATAAFGSEGAQRMVSAIQSGNFELETFGELLGDGTGIVEEQAAATETLADKFNILKNKVLVALGPIAIKIMDAFMGALDKLMPFVDKVIAAIEEFVKTEEFKNFKDTVVDVLKTVGEKIGEIAGAFGDWIKQNPETFLKGLATVIGVALTAAVWSLVGAIAALITPFTLTVAAIALFIAGAIWAYQNVDFFKESVDRWVESAKLFWGLLKDIWNWFANFDLGAVWASISEAVITAFDDTINHVADLTTRITDALYAGLWRFTQWGEDITAKIVDGVGDIAGTIKQKIMDLGSSIYAIGVKMKQWGKDLGRSLVNGIIGIWNKADLKMPRVEVPSWVPRIGGRGFGGFDIFPDIPALAAGGIVTSPTLALIGEAGPEAVVPLNGRHGMGGGVTVNVSGSVIAQDDLVEIIHRALIRTKNRNGSLEFG
jgi:phage-related minor tail protein